MSLSELRVFGRTGTLISPLTLGTMNFGEGGAPTGADEGIRIINAALDAGITAVDTADVYSQGESEQVVGRALRGRRDDVFIATKFHGQMSCPGVTTSPVLRASIGCWRPIPWPA